MSASDILSEILENSPSSPLTLFSSSPLVFSKSLTSRFNVLYFSSNVFAYSCSKESFNFSNCSSCSLRLLSISVSKSLSKSFLYSARSNSPSFEACFAFSKSTASAPLIVKVDDFVGVKGLVFLPLFFPRFFLPAIGHPLPNPCNLQASPLLS